MNNLIQPEIRAFLEKLLEDKGIKVKEDLRELMISDLHQRLQVRLTQLVAEHLSVSDLKALDELALERGQDEVQSFLRSKIKNLDKHMRDALQEFGEAFLKG